MIIETKWKRYAVAWHLSDYAGDPAQLFDALLAAESSQAIEQALDDAGASVWEKYEHESFTTLVEYIDEMACSLQDTANGALFAD